MGARLRLRSLGYLLIVLTVIRDTPILVAISLEGNPFLSRRRISISFLTGIIDLLPKSRDSKLDPWVIMVAPEYRWHPFHVLVVIISHQTGVHDTIIGSLE